jgi:HK97 family phage major capsid protein
MGARVSSWRDVERAARAAADVEESLPSSRTSDPQRMALYQDGTETESNTGQSVGATFVRSEAYGEWMRRYATGGPLAPGQFTSDPVRLGGFRTLVTSAATSAGTLVPPQQLGLLEPGLVRPLTLRQLLTVQSVSSDAVEFVRETSRTSAAIPVEEATALTGTSGTKPEAEVVFSKVTAQIRTFAVWIPATRRIIADASGLSDYINNLLVDDLAVAVEDQILTGDGTGENFLGLLNTPGTVSAGPPGVGENVLDVLRYAKREVRVQARTTPTAVLLNPADGAAVDTLKAQGSGNYLGAGPYGPGDGVSRVWGMPAVETEAIQEGTALVADFRRALLFDREETAISVGTVGDDYIRNLVRVLAETRLGLACLRPRAFCLVDLA